MARFSNPDPRHRPHGAKAILRWGVLDPLLGRRHRHPAGPPAPRVEPDLDLLHDGSPTPRLTWLGHASFLGSLGGRAFLVDPVFARRVGLVYRRHVEPGLRVDQLPPLTALLVSHNHYDHLDAGALRALPSEVPAVVPLGLGEWFRRWNRRPTVELEWWSEVDIDGLRITLVPARHWSRRGVFDTNRSWWGGFVVRWGGQGIYHAGDTARFDGFGEIGSRFPGLLAALLPVGGYSPSWFMEHHHLSPEQAGEAFRELGAASLVPMHWGTYQLTDEPLSEPIERLETWWSRSGLMPERSLEILAVDETLVLDGGGAA